MFVDIGANEGEYTTLLAKRFNKVYAFEPNPKAIPILTRRVSRYGNVSIIAKAVSNRNGETVLYEHPLSDRLGKRDNILGTPDAVGHTVPTVAYDTIINEKADLVKIDVEGAEFLVLEGMKQNLIDRNIRHLIIELHSSRDRLKLESLLTNYGFQVEWLDGDRLMASLRP